MKKSIYLLLFICNILNAQVQIGNTLNGSNINDLFGYATAISANGNIIAVGSPTIDNDGFVTAFQYSNGNWINYGNTILESDNQGNFGSVISISDDGNTLAVSSPYYDFSGGPGADLGRVQIYNYSAGNWIQSGNSIIGSGPDYLLGKSIALSGNGDRIAIGIPGSGAINQRGSVQIYTLINNVWTILGNSINATINDDNFGNEITFSSDGNTVAIADFNSSMLSNRIGKVKVYNYVAGNWIQKGGNIFGLLSEDSYRKFVSLNSDGSILAVGIPGSNTLGDYTGKVQVYSFQSNNWQQIGNDIFGSSVNDYFGGAVKLTGDGTILYVGSPGFNQQTGKLKIYKNINTTWTEIGSLVGDEPGVLLSNFISASSNKVVIGLPFNEVFAGQVKVYDINNLLNTESQSVLDAQIYPNPVKDGKLYIRQSHIELKRADIYAVTGELVKSYKLNQASNFIDVNDLASGVYFIDLHSDFSNLVKKVIIE